MMTEEEVQETGETMSDAPARSAAEVMSIAEAIIFVSDEPITSKMLGEIMGEDKQTVQAAVEGVADGFDHLPLLRRFAVAWQCETHRLDEALQLGGFLVREHAATVDVAAAQSTPPRLPG